MTAGVVTRLQQLDCDWADGHYTFALPVKQLEELQEKCDAGPRWIRLCLENKAEKAVAYYRETIRLGLIGGGLDPVKARNLVLRYADAQPAKAVLLAQAILSTWELGVPDEALKKAEGEATMSPSHLSPEEKSASPNSTDAAAQWGSTSVQ